MTIARVQLSNFLSVESGVMDLGPRVTLLTGGNGSGKTTRLEALIWGLWGQRLRPGQLQDGTSVVLEETSGEIERVVTPSGERVRIGGGDWQQKTKLLPDLEARFGSHAAWSRSLHLTGRSVGAFSGGSASYRWDHLVRLTGAARYDRAIELAAKEVREFGLRQEKLESEVRTSGWSVADATENYRRAAYALSGMAAPLPDVNERGAANLAKLRDTISRGEEAKKVKLAEIETAGAQFSAASNEIRRLRTAITAETAKRIPCPECGAPKPSQSLVDLDLELESASESERQKREAVYKLRDELATIGGKITELTRVADAQQTALERLAMYDARFQEAEQRALGLLLAYIAVKRRLRAASNACVAGGAELKEAEHVVAILKESRQLYLRGFLREINATAEGYLDLIGAKARAELVPVGENKLEIRTYGTGAESYAQCSGGEQRRIDLCLALAMSKVASGVGNLTLAVPLIVDEAFDSLDEQGMEALLSLACHISKERQVILVSHVLPDLPLGPDVYPTRLGP